MGQNNTLSADTLFHFTNKLDILESILTNGFYPKYSLENLESYTQMDLAFPMVCFCDIPLTQVNTHTSNYGEYAIGLEKTWGMKHNITPILYIHDNALTIRHILTISQELENSLKQDSIKHEKIDSAHPLYPMINSVFNLILCTKPYEGKQWEKGKRNFGNTKINFYNEREWRYLPTIDSTKNIKPIIDSNEFKNSALRELYDKFLIENHKLLFTPTEIKYIIVSKNKEIPDMVEKVESIMKQKYALKDRDIKLLITKITSMEQIRKDF